MNREILFRAKRIDNNEWIEGFYVILPLVHYDKSEKLITDKTGTSYEVDPLTVSQFTGLLDDLGNKIFENDILDIVEQMENLVYSGITLINDIRWENKSKFTVEFNPSSLMNTQRYANAKHISCKVIGNIFDDYELLEK